ncbi:TPA: hypothetical protein DEP96_03305 [Candidatus Uhrbacteria bacterium]|nr:hypothetical protein [Candidatus Uhrbacteria bacterium]
MQIIRRASYAVLLGLSIITMGSGCLPWQQEPVDDTTAVVAKLHAGSTLTIAQNWFGVSTPQDPVYGQRNVTIDKWTAGESAKLSWTLKSREETAESVAARAAAANVPVGQIAKIPDPVYIDVDTTGSVKTDGLGNAERILLPAYWPAQDYDVTGDQNSVLWLSRAQYDELTTTRTSHIALGLFDSTLEKLQNFSSNVTAALAKLEGKVASNAAATNSDITKLSADENWSNYTLNINGTSTVVRAVTANSDLANYVILANPENPLILKVSIKPLSLGFTMLSTLSLVKSLAGYTITSITY